MREIKFRAWLETEKRFFYQNDQYLQSFLKRCVRFSSKDAPSHHEKYGNYTLMQYTGLKDKNGKEIYEGDILQCPNYNYDPSAGDDPYNLIPVEYLNSGFKLNHEHLDEYHKDSKVIGNIYENPDLL